MDSCLYLWCALFNIYPKSPPPALPQPPPKSVCYLYHFSWTTSGLFFPRVLLPGRARGKEGLPTIDQETKYAHFSLLSSWLRLCIHSYLYPIKSIQLEPLMSCLFQKSTISLEIIYSIITAYQILLTGDFDQWEFCVPCMCVHVFRFLKCWRQSLLSPEELFAV
jgi:hypothetical protein